MREYSSTLLSVQKPSIQIISLIIAFALLVFSSSFSFAQTDERPQLGFTIASDSSPITETTEPSGTPTVTPLPPPVNPINLTLSPITLQLEVNPGETKTGEIKIRNNSTEAEALRVSFATFSFNDATQQINLNNQSDETFLKWISVDQPEFVVQPSEWSTVNVTFTPPPEASLGYYFAVIFNRVSEPVEGGTTKISGAPAVLVLSNVISPLAKRELQLDSFKVPKVWVEFLPQQFLLNIRNSGNVHLPPTGNIFIDSRTKKDIAVLSINPANSLILPNSSREYTVTWSDGFPKWVDETEKDQTILDENGQTKQKLEWNFAEADRFRIGKYTAHLLLVYDNGERDVPIESFVSFWVIPWRISIAVIIISIFFLLGIRSTVADVFRSFRRKK